MSHLPVLFSSGGLCSYVCICVFVCRTVVRTMQSKAWNFSSSRLFPFSSSYSSIFWLVLFHPHSAHVSVLFGPFLPLLKKSGFTQCDFRKAVSSISFQCFDVSVVSDDCLLKEATSLNGKKIDFFYKRLNNVFFVVFFPVVWYNILRADIMQI